MTVNDGDALYPGIKEVTNGNGAVAYVMRHVCGGVIGYPITPSTEISEIFEAARAEGQMNVWGKHPFFVETEGEHSAQSGALGAALTGGNYVSNASSSQGILYGMESHYVTVGKKIGGFVLQVAARAVSRASLNVMAGHDDIYALLPAGYTVFFASNAQEAADFAAISFRTSALSLVPVANTMDGFATSHMMGEVTLPRPALLREYLGDPNSRIPCPTVAQGILFGAKGRVFQLSSFLDRHSAEIDADNLLSLRTQLELNADSVENDNAAALVSNTLPLLPESLHNSWRRAWKGAWKKGTRQLVPALVDPNNPGLTGPVQNQADYQASVVDHRTHFANEVPRLARLAMEEYARASGNRYTPVMSYGCEDADYIMVGLGSITDDVRAVIPYLRQHGIRVGVVSIKLLQPFPEAEVAEAVKNAKAVMVLERSDNTVLTSFVSQALLKARANGERSGQFPDVGAIDSIPKLSTAIFGLGGHDVQPRHIVAAFKNMATGSGAPLIYLGSQFFGPTASSTFAELQEKMRAAYPETELMALETEPNPKLLSDSALRIRFHSVGGYGTVSTGKLLTEILSDMLGMYSKSTPKYGSEKSGAATNYYITLSPEPVLLTNAELEDVEVVVCPDHQVFKHTNPLRGLVDQGTLIIQSDKAPLEVWLGLPAFARQYIRERGIKFHVLDAFAVARHHAPTPELETRMMGIAFIGSVIGSLPQLTHGKNREEVHSMLHGAIDHKFGRKGTAVVDSNMAVIDEAIAETKTVDYRSHEFQDAEAGAVPGNVRTATLSASMCPFASEPRTSLLFDPAYYEDLMARPFRDGTISEAPVLPGAGMFIPSGSGVFKDKGLFRRTIPLFDPTACTGCMECTIACPDSAIPNTVHELSDLLLVAIAQSGASDEQVGTLRGVVPAWAEGIRESLKADSSQSFAQAARTVAVSGDFTENTALTECLDAIIARLNVFPVAATRPFFTAPEKANPGSGGLFSVVIDPWKCTGCQQCVAVCGPGALTTADQTDENLAAAEQTFEVLTKLPTTPQRFTENSADDLKRILLARENYYAITGGHGACRGCGEVTATHLISALSRAFGEDRRRGHMAELDSALASLHAKRDEVDDERGARIGALIDTLEERLYLYEGGPTGRGPASTVFANATGCTSVYSSTLPSTQFLDPWVNSLFQDSHPLAQGIYEGLVSQWVGEVKALRLAMMELSDSYDESGAAALDTLSWRDFSPAERDLLPTVCAIGGDGAVYDIGFGALSRVMTSNTPIKAVVLDTGGYSNTGGQASTASFTGQDADLARFGASHVGKAETRKELGLLAAFHPKVFACSTATAMHGHFLETTARMLNYKYGTAVMVVYTPCGTESGIPENLSNAHSRLAVESRMSPLFVHDPTRGESLPERFSLAGNPDIDKLWAESIIEHVDDSGNPALLRVPLTPADFARGEVRFSKQFHKLSADDSSNAVLISDFIELGAQEREGKVPFVWATDAEKRLIKVGCSTAIVRLVVNRKRYWRQLQYLAGIGVSHESEGLRAELEKESAELRAELDAVKAESQAANQAREASMDAIAEAMVSLVMSRDANPCPPPLESLMGGSDEPEAQSPPRRAAESDAPASAQAGESSVKPIWLDPTDQPRCTDCGTCYQELPELFERTTILVDGQAKSVAQMKPGVLDTMTVTPELEKRFAKVRDTCDSEIIR